MRWVEEVGRQRVRLCLVLLGKGRYAHCPFLPTSLTMELELTLHIVSSPPCPFASSPSSIQALDYSSDIDPFSSSPVKQSQPQPHQPSHPSSTPGTNTFKRKRPLNQTKKEQRKRRKALAGAAPTVDEVARTTKYDCIGVVRVKVVFSKR